MPESKGYRIEKSIFNRFFIVHPTDNDLAWTGMCWARHLRGIPDSGVQISNFGSKGEADQYARENIFKWHVATRRPAFKPKPGFTQRTHCPECGADLSIHGMIVMGQERCRMCHTKKAASKARVEKMHDARWGSQRRADDRD